MTHTQPRWLYRAGDLLRGPWETVVDEAIPGWSHTGLSVATLAVGESVALDRSDVERLVVPLHGSFTVHHLAEDGTSRHCHLVGRASVFAGPTDVLYLPTASTARIEGSGRVAVAFSRTRERKPVRRIDASEVPVEIRGAGQFTRQVHNFGTPETLDADRLIVCEVLTPPGNWSSYPPHKHDERIPGSESRLEEIYYFDARPIRDDPMNAPGAAGVFRAHSSHVDAITIDEHVHAGDVALVPHGYHGPAIADPDHDLYYLNVMAGPDPEREWRISDDPALTSIRESWATTAPDPRLPYQGETR